MNGQADALQTLFREGGRRLTAQRRQVLEVLEQSERHLDAEAIHDRVKRQNPNISLATVYRTLTVFKEMGLVEEHSLGQEHSHYEAARPEPHYHFICLGCGQVIEFDTPSVAQAVEELAGRLGIQVTDAHLRLSGYCAQCQTHPTREATTYELR